jgi:hypothetical protein
MSYYCYIDSSLYNMLNGFFNTSLKNRQYRYDSVRRVIIIKIMELFFNSTKHKKDVIYISSKYDTIFYLLSSCTKHKAHVS